MRNAAGSLLVVAAWMAMATSSEAGGPFRYTTITPCRLVDTRNPNGPYGGPALSNNGQRTFLAQGSCGVPVGASAISINLTAVDPTVAGHLTPFPNGIGVPNVSALNFIAGQTVPNGAIVPLGDASTPGGDLVIRAGFAALPASVHVLVDITGYFAASAPLKFNPIKPCRILHTSNPNGPYGGPSFSPLETRRFLLQGAPHCPIPVGAQAVSFTVTVLNSTTTGFVTVFPNGTTMPNVSTVNLRPAWALANSGIVKLSPATTPNGDLAIFAGTGTASLGMILDVTGYFQ
jgi:hypothetical protein